MELIKNKTFGGERPLFGAHDARLEDITITDGESGIKCCKNIECHNSKFYGKYPWWHVDGSLITDCYFAPESRSAIWYSNNMVMKDCTIDGPKFFREMKNLELENVNITDADETFRKVNGLKIKNVKLHEAYIPIHVLKEYLCGRTRKRLEICIPVLPNVEIHNAKITTKDSLRECENVTVYDSELNGEYLAWHSKNIKLVRCHISGEQPLCYMDHVILEDCTFDKECDRAFEDCSNIDAHIKGCITNIKNPISGRIEADKVGSITYTKFAKAPQGACEIIDKSEA